MPIGDSFEEYGAVSSNQIISELRKHDSDYIRNRIDYDYNGSYDDYYDDDPDIVKEYY